DTCFFSSRRRHTRFKCDWSSDVCSSDLSVGFRGTTPMSAAGQTLPPSDWDVFPVDQTAASSPSPPHPLMSGLEAGPIQTPELPRSEERRVGKEGRNRRTVARSHKKQEES